MFRRLLVFLILTLALIASNANLRISYAQTEPLAIIDAVLADLSTKLGVSMSRTHMGNATYSWSESPYDTQALGCPAAGVTYTAVKTFGYQILVVYKGITYDYRASIDGQTIFQCVNGLRSNTLNNPTPVSPNTTQGQTYTNPIAYIGPDGNVYVGQFGATQGFTKLTNNANTGTTGSRQTYANLIWSPDGQTLAFIGTNANKSSLLISRAGQPLRALVAALDMGRFPPFWLPDSKEVGYAVAGVTNQQTGEQPFQILAAMLDGGRPSRSLGTVTYTNPLGGGGFSGDMASGKYNEETGTFGKPFLVRTANGTFIYTVNDYRTVAASNGAATLWSRQELTNPALSPDGTHLIARIGNSANNLPGTAGADLVMVDLATGNPTVLTTQPGFDQATWAGNDTIVYSTLTNPRQLIPNNLNAFQGAGGAMYAYTTNLWKMPLSGGASTQLFTANGRGIGQISAATDQSTVAFTLIPSMEAAVNAVNSGATKDVIQASAIIHVTMRSVTLSGQATPQMIEGEYPTLGRGSFSSAANIQPNPAGQSVTSPHKISFAPGAISAVVKGQTGPNQLTDAWVMTILQGQTLTATLAFSSGSGVLTVIGADGTPLQTDHAGSPGFKGVIPHTGDYYLTVVDATGAGSTYTLTVTVPPPGR